MRRLAAVLALVVVGAPLLVAPSSSVVTLGVLALILCGLGILVGTPVLAVGMIVALAEYALALRLADGPPRLAGAAMLGVALVLLLEVADFGLRARRAAIGPRVVATQLRAWSLFAALASAGALLAGAAASIASASVRMPWAPALAAAGAAVTLVATALALAATRARPDD